MSSLPTHDPDVSGDGSVLSRLPPSKYVWESLGDFAISPQILNKLLTYIIADTKAHRSTSPYLPDPQDPILQKTMAIIDGILSHTINPAHFPIDQLKIYELIQALQLHLVGEDSNGRPFVSYTPTVIGIHNYLYPEYLQAELWLSEDLRRHIKKRIAKHKLTKTQHPPKNIHAEFYKLAAYAREYLDKQAAVLSFEDLKIIYDLSHVMAEHHAEFIGASIDRPAGAHFLDSAAALQLCQDSRLPRFLESIRLKQKNLLEVTDEIISTFQGLLFMREVPEEEDPVDPVVVAASKDSAYGFITRPTRPNTEKRYATFDEEELQQFERLGWHRQVNDQDRVFFYETGSDEPILELQRETLLVDGEEKTLYTCLSNQVPKPMWLKLKSAGDKLTNLNTILYLNYYGVIPANPAYSKTDPKVLANVLHDMRPIEVLQLNKQNSGFLLAQTTREGSMYDYMIDEAVAPIMYNRNIDRKNFQTLASQYNKIYLTILESAALCKLYDSLTQTRQWVIAPRLVHPLLFPEEYEARDREIERILQNLPHKPRKTQQTSFERLGQVGIYAPGYIPKKSSPADVKETRIALESNLSTDTPPGLTALQHQENLEYILSEMFKNHKFWPTPLGVNHFCPDTDLFSVHPTYTSLEDPQTLDHHLQGFRKGGGIDLLKAMDLRDLSEAEVSLARSYIKGDLSLKEFEKLTVPLSVPCDMRRSLAEFYRWGWITPEGMEELLSTPHETHIVPHDWAWADLAIDQIYTFVRKGEPSYEQLKIMGLIDPSLFNTKLSPIDHSALLSDPKAFQQALSDSVIRYRYSALHQNLPQSIRDGILASLQTDSTFRDQALMRGLVDIVTERNESDLPPSLLARKGDVIKTRILKALRREFTKILITPAEATCGLKNLHGDDPETEGFGHSNTPERMVQYWVNCEHGPATRDPSPRPDGMDSEGHLEASPISPLCYVRRGQVTQIRSTDAFIKLSLENQTRYGEPPMCPAVIDLDNDSCSPELIENYNFLGVRTTPQMTYRPHQEDASSRIRTLIRRINGELCQADFQTISSLQNKIQGALEFAAILGKGLQASHHDWEKMLQNPFSRGYLQDRAHALYHDKSLMGILFTSTPDSVAAKTKGLQLSLSEKLSR